MSSKKLVVYPRGFIGFVHQSLNRESNQRSVSDQLIDIRYKTSKGNEDKKDVYNVNVVKMYGAMIDGLNTHDKLKFNKAIIIETLKSFNDLNLLEWINIQKNSRYFSLKHQKFILDTLHFVAHGKRQTSIRTWEVILHRKSIDDEQSVTSNPMFDKTLQTLFTALADDDLPMGTSLLRIIPQWLSHRGGNEDLLLTLNLLFGKELNI